MKRTATAEWQGTGKEGKGFLTTQSNILNKAQYSYNSRFAEGTGTNPEELIAAAHAGCFSMKLAFNIVAAGFKADNINTTATVTLDNGAITTIHLKTMAKVPGMESVMFDELAKDAKVNCPVSKVLNATITLDATLDQKMVDIIS